MADFQTALQFMLPHEGGYSNDPTDPGGETNMGISKRSYPSMDIKNLTMADVSMIYRRDFWSRLCGDELQNQDVANKVFDLSVNIGIRNAVLILQNACLRCDIPIKPDGLMGSKTIIATNLANSIALVAEIKALAVEHYQELAHYHPALQRFLGGWLRRANA